jgi:hypothetical protein
MDIADHINCKLPDLSYTHPNNFLSYLGQMTGNFAENIHLASFLHAIGTVQCQNPESLPTGSRLGLEPRALALKGRCSLSEGTVTYDIGLYHKWLAPGFYSFSEYPMGSGLAIKHEEG